MQALEARAGEIARPIEVRFSTYESETGRSGEEHALWERRGLPVLHERGEERVDRVVHEGFLRREDVTRRVLSRTLVLDDAGGWRVIYWRSSRRGTEHGWERSFHARGALAIDRARAIAMFGADAIRAALAALVVPPADRCLTLDEDARPSWCAVPSAGSSHHHDTPWQEPERGDAPLGAEPIPELDDEPAEW